MQPFLDSFDTPLLYGMTEYVGRSYSERSTNYGYGGRTSTNVVIKPKKSKDSMIVPASGHVLLAEGLAAATATPSSSTTARASGASSTA